MPLLYDLSLKSEYFSHSCIHIQRGAVIARSISSKFLTIDTPNLAREGAI